MAPRMHTAFPDRSSLSVKGPETVDQSRTVKKPLVEPVTEVAQLTLP